MTEAPLENTKLGKILKGVGGFYTVLCADGRKHTCKARGLFRKTGQTPLPGDNVKISVDKKGEGYIMEILPRENELLRPAAANIDMLLIVVAASEPEPDLELADKLLLYCRRQGIRPVLVINKCDAGVSPKSEAIEAQYSGALDDILAVSAETGFGMDKLKELLSGCTVCLAGQSAVGKSSLINWLMGLELKTGGLSVKTERGRHTTRHAELIPMPSGGFIADTPGFSMLESVPLEPEEIPAMYLEFTGLGSCRFIGCMHISEPDCAVKAAVEAGEISKERYERYKKIANEAIEMRRHRYD
jgi:ribosome biogenesis GTPase